MQAHIETLKERLAEAEGRFATAEARIETLVAELADRGAQHADERAVILAQVATDARTQRR